MKKYLLPLLALLYFASCSDSNTTFEQKLKTAVTADEAGTNGYKTVNLAELTDFEWDRLYFFQAGEDKKSISDAIGFKWEGAAVDAGYRRLLFVKGEEVVSYTDYLYSEFPLFVYGCQGDKWVYPSSRSTFATFKYCSGEDEVYAFIPVACVGDISELMANKCPEKAK